MFVSNMNFSQEPVTLALAAVASWEGLFLHQLISEQHLGTRTFTALRTLLTKLTIGSCHARVCGFLRQCALFEDLNGALLTPSQLSGAKVLPSNTWEKRVVAMPDIFPLTVIKYHSATSTQRKLLDRLALNPSTWAPF